MKENAGIMTQATRRKLAACWSRVLRYQTDCFGAKELAILRSWGLGENSRGVLDLGCGSGEYGCFLARHLPQVAFLGLEPNAAFVARCRTRLVDRGIVNYQVCEGSLGGDSPPDAVAGRFDQSLLRLVLQHTPEPIRVLKDLHGALPAGGRVHVIEEDDGFFHIFPECAAFDRVIEIWRSVCESGGTQRYLGRALPSLLQESGFELRQVEVLVHSSFEVGEVLLDYLVETVRLLRLTNPGLVGADEADEIERVFQQYLAKNRRRWFAVYPQVLALGSKT